MTFYGIEIIYTREYFDTDKNKRASEMGMHTFVNCAAGKVREIRETILAQGLQVPVSLTQWQIIFPNGVYSMTVYRQDKFFSNMHSDLKKTVFDMPAGETQKMI